MESSTTSLLVAAVVGYLAGSVSGARIIGSRMNAGDLSHSKVVLDGTGSSVDTHGVSPSSLQARRGGKAGLSAGAIDILKALIPTLVARLLWPDTPEHVLVAAGTIVGHVYPIYHRFLGGYGISPLLGALAIIDLRAPLAAILVLGIVGFIAGSAYLGIETWPVALVPWFLWQGDGWTVAFAVLANVLYWWRSRDEAIGAFRSYRGDTRRWRDRIGDFAMYPDFQVPDR